MNLVVRREWQVQKGKNLRERSGKYLGHFLPKFNLRDFILVGKEGAYFLFDIYETAPTILKQKYSITIES